MRTLAEYIAELHRRDRNDNRTGQHAAFDTTIEDDSNWQQGNGPRDDGHCENTAG